MNIKSTAIILLTLLIGFVLGVLSTGRFVQSQVSNLQQLREAPMQKLLETIAPTEEQRQQLEPVLQKYASEIKELNLQHKEILQETIDSLLSEIQPVLNGDQLNRIETRRKVMQEREKQGTLPPFNRWFMRRQFNKPPMQKPNAAGNADSLQTQQPQNLGKPALPTAADTARWQQKMQHRRQNSPFTPPPDSIKEIIWKKRQGETLTAQDSATLRQFRQQQREKRFSDNNAPDSLPPPPQHFRNRPRPFAPNDSAGLPPPGRQPFKHPKYKQAPPHNQPGTGNN